VHEADNPELQRKKIESHYGDKIKVSNVSAMQRMVILTYQAVYA
jgi:hypothetical protein